MHLVAPRTSGRDGTVLEPQALLDRAPSLSLNERSLDLSVVNSGIDTLPDVHLDVHSEDSVVPREGVELNFRDGDSLGIVVEEVARWSLLIPDVAEARGGVVACGGQGRETKERGTENARGGRKTVR